jgi:hypothetical protein
MAKEERRLHDRYRLWLPARIEGGDRVQLGVGHDMSQKGLLLVTNVELSVGAEIVLFLRLPPDSEEERRFEARVLRCDVNEADPEGLWPYRLAVEFVRADPSLDELLRGHVAMLEGIAERGQQDR